jgi:hypothetical protein
MIAQIFFCTNVKKENHTSYSKGATNEKGKTGCGSLAH